MNLTPLTVDALKIKFKIFVSSDCLINDFVLDFKCCINEYSKLLDSGYKGNFFSTIHVN